MRWWDLAALLPLERAVFGPDAWSVELFWSELAGVPATRTYVVAEDGVDLVGYAGLHAGLEEATVQTLAVAPHRQRTGLGSRLLEHLLNDAAARDLPTVLLEVRADNTAALALYARHGFARVGLRRGYYRGSGVDGLVLCRRASTSTGMTDVTAWSPGQPASSVDQGSRRPGS